ncbi:MAG TPA: alpha/beta fold hydrolase [Nevskiaceae bacterium]|nr:alpha/beta fold hydrolase [Nevskiaceae bacterium]
MSASRWRGGLLQGHEKLAAAANNAFDWLFLRGVLVQSGQTPYEVLLEDDPMRLRWYPVPDESRLPLEDGQFLPVRRERHPLPLVLIPPLGVTSETFDLLPQRSLVRYFAARGFQTYLVDWGEPERRHARLGLEDYALRLLGRALEEVRRHSGVQAVSLFGWCMGGLLALMHAGATGDARIRNLVTVASPIDLRSGGLVGRSTALLNGPARLIRRFTGFRLAHLDPERWQLPGWATTWSFRLTDPVGSITTYWDLLTRLWDREFVERHATTADYLNNMLVYPVGVLREMVVQMGIDNRLSEGQIQVGRQVADLARIQANLLVMAGNADVLVSPAAARRSLDLVSSEDRQFRLAPGGHMGVVLGRQAQAEVWEPSAQWLDLRSALQPGDEASPLPKRRPRRRRLAEDPTL